MEDTSASRDLLVLDALAKQQQGRPERERGKGQGHGGPLAEPAGLPCRLPTVSTPPNASSFDHRTASGAASLAGQLLISIRAEGMGRRMAPDDLGRRGDRLANELILSLLAATHPRDAILSEESADDSRRLTAERVWIIDPLDGTREFVQPGRSDWAVHVALVERGRPTAAAVALPAQALTLATSPEGLTLIAEDRLGDPVTPSGAVAIHPARLTTSVGSQSVAPSRLTVTEGLPSATGSPLRLVLSESRPPPEGRAIQAALDAEMIPMGSAGQGHGGSARPSRHLCPCRWPARMGLGRAGRRGHVRWTAHLTSKW